MEKKLTLGEVKVKSFATALSNKRAQAIEGGKYTVTFEGMNCKTECGNACNDDSFNFGCFTTPQFGCNPEN